MTEDNTVHEEFNSFSCLHWRKNPASLQGIFFAGCSYSCGAAHRKSKESLGNRYFSLSVGAASYLVFIRSQKRGAFWARFP